ncbi:MAG: hypothetical protein GC178_11030 [Flavobacteriales bacterium]|nr:hypothetical protein [Flavobacteriales bacterium]
MNYKEAVKREVIQLFVFFFLSAFIFNQAVNCMHNQKLQNSYCNEMSEEVSTDLDLRFGPFNPDLPVSANFISDLIQSIFSSTNAGVQNLGNAYSAFSVATHVPIYLGKCTLII